MAAPSKLLSNKSFLFDPKRTNSCPGFEDIASEFTFPWRISLLEPSAELLKGWYTVGGWRTLEQFTEYYYSQFDADRKSLAPLYRDNSMLTFESSSVGGVGPIVEKLSVYVVYPIHIAWYWCSSNSLFLSRKSSMPFLLSTHNLVLMVVSWSWWHVPYWYIPPKSADMWLTGVSLGWRRGATYELYPNLSASPW